MLGSKPVLKRVTSVARAFIGFCVALAAVGFVQGTAYASGNNVKIVSADGSDFCMDASVDRAGRDGDPVYLYKCHGRENQRWTVTESGDGQSALIGMGGYCLDVRGTHSKADGTPVQLWKCHFGANQRFSLTPTGQLREQASGKCLLVTAVKDRAPIVLDECKNEPGQKWKLEK